MNGIILISTHAPTQGKTAYIMSGINYRFISTHAPTQGGGIRGKINRRYLLFQFTLPRRERWNCLRIFLYFQEVSTHAPTQGAIASEPSYGIAVPEVSIHAPTQGAIAYGLKENPVKMFQLTLPRRERQAQYKALYII